MSIKEKLIKALGGMTQEEAAARTVEATENYVKQIAKQAAEIAKLKKISEAQNAELKALRELIDQTAAANEAMKGSMRLIQTPMDRSGDIVNLFQALVPYIQYSHADETEDCFAHITIIKE